MRISDCSSDVCSSDLLGKAQRRPAPALFEAAKGGDLLHQRHLCRTERERIAVILAVLGQPAIAGVPQPVAELIDADEDERAHRGHVERARERGARRHRPLERAIVRSEEHTSELQSLMRNSYAVFCLKKKIKTMKKQAN